MRIIIGPIKYTLFTQSNFDVLSTMYGLNLSARRVFLVSVWRILEVELVELCRTLLCKSRPQRCARFGFWIVVSRLLMRQERHYRSDDELP